jgi:hypothetical protein
MTNTGDLPRILALWSAPRSRSTAFLRMMTERGDYLVVHEPFSHVIDFGAAKVGDVEVHTELELIATLRELATTTPVFFKDTTDFHYPGLLADATFLAEATHTFIIRHPKEAIASHYAINQDLRRDEIGFAWLAEIYDAVAAATGAEPIVVDSDDLVARPAETVGQYCAQVGIPFVPDALSWQPGLREEWQKTRPWHESTSRTSGFTRTAADHEHTTDNNPLLAEYLDYHLPFYEKLHARRMIVGDA